MSADRNDNQDARKKAQAEVDLPLSSDWRPALGEPSEPPKTASETEVKPQTVETPAASEACPKCGFPKSNPQSCDRCGLVFAKWRGTPKVEAPIIPATDAVANPMMANAPEAAAPTSDIPVSPTPPATSAQPVKPPVKVCPKCGHGNDNELSCAMCGLNFANWKPELEQELYAEMPPGSLEQARLLWQAVERDCENERTLDNFHNYCSQQNGLRFASTRYRAFLATNPDSAAIRLRLDQVVRQAGMMLPDRPPREKSERLSTKGILIALVVGAVVGLAAYALTMMMIGG